MRTETQRARVNGQSKMNTRNVKRKRGRSLYGTQSAPCEVPHAIRGSRAHAHRGEEESRYLDGLVDVVRLGVDRPDGDLELGNADLAVAAGVDRVEDRAQLLVGEAAAAAGRARRPQARWSGVGSAESGPLRAEGRHVRRSAALLNAAAHTDLFANTVRRQERRRERRRER